MSVEHTGRYDMYGDPVGGMTDLGIPVHLRRRRSDVELDQQDETFAENRRRQNAFRRGGDDAGLRKFLR